MNQEQLFSFYEKHYFQELERREQLSARLNVPLAILVAVVGLLSFMCTMSSYATVVGIPALMIREGNTAGEVRVLMPLGSFSPSEALEYEEDGQRLLLSPVAIVEQAADYELARYRRGTRG